ncbi:hypothetical protein CRENBAI_025533 [Crenichthys baileyi]|uniref:Uncharacterized protein n=1 Tax=Crenichthys baileyi TaxID=28760 RepID=A0AAV9RHN9_9TELE
MLTQLITAQQSLILRKQQVATVERNSKPPAQYEQPFPVTNGRFETTEQTHKTPEALAQEHQVKNQLERQNRNKAAGPDGISPRVVKTCTEQLCEDYVL